MTTETRLRLSSLIATLLTALYSLAHLLAAVSLVAFGLLAGGYPLNRWGIYGYAGAVATALILSLRALRQRDDRPNALLLTLPPLLALWVMGLYASTEALSAEFAPYLDDVNKLFLVFNLAYALLGCWLALAYHWPRLLVIWAGGQGVLLLTNPALWATLLRSAFAPPLTGLWLTALAYALTALALGYRVPWRRVLKWLWPFALAGAGMAAYALVTVLRSGWYGEREALPWVVGLTVLDSLLTTGLTLSLPFHAWRIGRTWPEEGLARRPDRWAWVAFLVILFLMNGASAGQLRIGDGGLPAPMEVQRWGPAERVVPDAYLPTITWAGWLFSALRWLLIPTALLILWEAWWKRAERPVGARPRWNEFPRLLLWPALASTGIFLTSIYPLNMLSFVLGVAWDSQMGLLQGLSPLLVALGLLWLYRLWEQEWEQRMRTLWALLTAGLLALYAVWQVQALIAYGRVLFAPLPAWETSWEYAPIDPMLMATIGLILHVALLTLGLWAMVRTVQETWRPEGRFALPRPLLWRGLALALIAVLLLGTGWYWWTAPGIGRTVPPNGATDVPRNTRILVEFRQDARPWGMGWGMHTRYADTGDYIPGGTGGGPGGMRFDPEGLLRPNAPVEITVYRDGRRPYVLRFTTAGVDSPTATPLPPREWFGFEGLVPTPATPPTQDPRIIPTPAPIVYRPTDWPRDISAIIDCPTGPDTAEKCLSQEYPQRVQLVGYLIPAAGGFVLLRGSQRLPVSLALAEGYPRENIDWLCEHGYLTAVQGELTSLDPPTMLVSEAHGAAHSFLARSTPLAELYTNPEWGMAIEYPAGWVVEPAGSSDPTAIYIQNFHNADVFVPLAGGSGVEADPSLYRVRLYPVPQEYVATLEEARAGFPQGLKMHSMMINGLPILRFRWGDGVTEVALVQLADRVLMLSTGQDPALFERMLEALRPTLTEAPAATSTPVTPAPAYATQEAARQATVVARATASPFPTAGLATVRTGQPASATTRRHGLSFQVRLPKDTYLAGEGGQAEVILRNDGPETVFIHGGLTLFGLALLDEQGHGPAPWPWLPMSLPMPPNLQKLAPGQVMTETLNFQVPPAEQATGHTYDLWAVTGFSRPDPNSPEGPNNLWLHLEVGPIPLQVTMPTIPEQYLVGHLQADRDGWCLQVTDATGQTPPGPLWGELEAASPNAAIGGHPLRDNTDGTWSAAWDDHMRRGDGQIIVRAWVAALGYVTAAITQTVPGGGDARYFFGVPGPSTYQTFPTLETAQMTVDFPLARPGNLPAGAELTTVQVETMHYEGGQWTNVTQVYRLSGGTWLELTQMVNTERYESAGWGQARYAPEARPVTVGQTTGYVIQRFDWWVLDWKIDDVGFELRAPLPVLSLDNLVTIAAGVQPPEEGR